MTDQACDARHVVTGVQLSCHRVRSHTGPHASSTYGTRWRDSGEVLPPPAAPQPRGETRCKTAGCTLWIDHAGPHGEQAVLPL